MRHPAQGDAFGGLNNGPINFGSKTPKTNFGPMNMTFKCERQENSITSIRCTLSRSCQNYFTRDSHDEWAVVGRSTTFLNKSKMADGGCIDLRKMLIYLYWMKTFAQNLVQRCSTTTRRCPRDQKRNRKLIRMTSSVECREQMWVVVSDYTTYLNQIWYTAQELDNHRGGTCKIHLKI